jgi:hypothetical protein
MNYGPELLLVAAVASVGVLHTIIPDHWVPITLLARQRGWSKSETALAALGHFWRSGGSSMLACLLPAAALALISEPRRWSQSKVAGELTSQRADQPAVNLAGNRQTLIRPEKPNCAAISGPMTPSETY